MSSQPTPIRIPLLGISGKVERGSQIKGLPPGLKRISEVDTSAPHEQCFALELPDIIEEIAVTGKSLGVFGLDKGMSALKDIYALGIKGQEPLICKVIKSDAQSHSSSEGESALSASRAKNHRKSFMTPTPLHIPESRVSPIPDSTHEMIYLKGLRNNEAVKVIPLQDVVWTYPLIAVMENFLE